jgi:hypothetical protein
MIQTNNEINIPQLSIVWNEENYINVDEINKKHMDGTVRVINSHICQSYGMKLKHLWQNPWMMKMAFHAFFFCIHKEMQILQALQMTY